MATVDIQVWEDDHPRSVDPKHLYPTPAPLDAQDQEYLRLTVPLLLQEFFGRNEFLPGVSLLRMHQVYLERKMLIAFFRLLHVQLDVCLSQTI